MKKIEYLKKEKFLFLANKYGGKHWEKELLEDRWDYHSRVVEILKHIRISKPEDVLEMGTMGVTCIEGSQTIDFIDKLNLKGNRTSYIHDARDSPWPLKDKQFEVFIALRVFQHLTPKQEDALVEAFRIAKKIILVVPNNYNVKYFPKSKGMTYEDYSKVLNGLHPNLFLPTNFGDLYFWDTDNPNYLNIESVMEHYKQFLIAYSKRKIGFFKKVKFRIRKLNLYFNNH